MLRPFRERIGRDVLGNKAASGTEIIAELGEEHVATGRPIVYTSADSVFQIAAHVDVIPLRGAVPLSAPMAREILTGPHAVARVIARPFAGEPGRFTRTADRKDFSLAPPEPTYLDLLSERGVPVAGGGQDQPDLRRPGSDRGEQGGFQRRQPGAAWLGPLAERPRWAHLHQPGRLRHGLGAPERRGGLRRRAGSRGRRPARADLELLGPEDRLLITADHGVDPTTVSTDHSREYVPLLYYPRPPGTPEAAYEGLMWDTGATVFAHLTGERPPLGGRPLERLDSGEGVAGVSRHGGDAPRPAQPGEGARRRRGGRLPPESTGRRSSLSR